MNIKRLAATGVMLAMLLTGAVMAHGEAADFGNPADFKTGMEENFYVQEGSFRELDTIRDGLQGQAHELLWQQCRLCIHRVFPAPGTGAGLCHRQPPAGMGRRSPHRHR